MASLLKILTDTSCDVYVDYEYRGHAEPYKLLRLELRKGCYILEFKYKDMILESQDYVMPSNDEETLLKLSLADKYAAAQELKRTLFYIATEKLDADRLCPESNIATHTYNETDGKGSITFCESIIEIGECAFFDCASLKSITIPESVTSIGRWAFCSCTSLTSIIIPESVTEIESAAFGSCTSLISVTIPDSIAEIGECAFSGCTSLTSVIIPESVTKIGEQAFSGCVLLASVTIPDSVKKIGSGAFEGCVSLVSITIPDSVTSIGNRAFSGCTSLTSVTIPDSVTWIGIRAFSGCTSLLSFYGKYASIDNRCLIVDNALVAFAPASLTSYAIPDSVTSIGDSSFYDCTSLIGVTIPDSVTSIGNSAFSGCASLIGVTIPDSVTSIGNSAFSGCASLIGVTIPDSVTSIGNGAFFGCASLVSITIPESVTSIAGFTFCNCISLKSIAIPNSVTEIGYSAFQGCTSLKSITIPEEIKLGSFAIELCNVSYFRNTKYYETRGKYLFFDTETTGLPINYNAPTGDLFNWPRMVQLSWMLTDNEGAIISKGNFIIKPSGFVISDSAIELHGITNEIANQKGVALQEVLAKFVEDVNNSTCLVGHNVEFDKHVVGAELLRMGEEDIVSYMTSICTMMSSIDYCKIINSYGYKYPKLQELYAKLFDEEFEDAHDALADVYATYRCFFELKRRNIINDNF